MVTVKLFFPEPNNVVLLDFNGLRKEFVLLKYFFVHFAPVGEDKSLSKLNEFHFEVEKSDLYFLVLAYTIVEKFLD
jgi:hypothetical protein